MLASIFFHASSESRFVHNASAFHLFTVEFFFSLLDVALIFPIWAIDLSCSLFLFNYRTIEAPSNALYVTICFKAKMRSIDFFLFFYLQKHSIGMSLNHVPMKLGNIKFTMFRQNKAKQQNDEKDNEKLWQHFIRIDRKH